MQGYLIYKPEEAKKNQAFIDLFYTAGRNHHVRMSYVSYADFKQAALPDFVFNRTRDSGVSEWYEKQGVRVFHQKEVVTLGNNKWQMINYLQRKIRQNQKVQDDILLPWTMYQSAGQLKTYLMHNKQLMEEVGAVFDKETGIRHKKICPADFVIKTVDGHGGNEVFLLSDFWDKRELLANHDCLIQEKIQSDAKDLRVYILEGNIYQAMLRQGTVDFRSNYSLGGTAVSYTLSKAEREQIEAVLMCFREDRLALNMVGLDFILRTDGRLVFNELEEMVGCRMLYANTDKDIVEDVMRYIEKGFAK